MLDLYRIFVTEDNRKSLYDAILGIRPDESKIQFIGTSQGYVRVDITISEEELAFLKLAIPFARKEAWIQQWPNP